MDRIFPASRRVNKTVGPLLRRVTKLPVASDEVFSAGRRFYGTASTACAKLLERSPGDHQRAARREPGAHW